LADPNRDWVRSVACSGGRVVSSGRDASVRVWELAGAPPSQQHHSCSPEAYPATIRTFFSSLRCACGSWQVRLQVNSTTHVPQKPTPLRFAPFSLRFGARVGAGRCASKSTAPLMFPRSLPRYDSHLFLAAGCRARMRRGCGRDAEGGAGGGVSIDTGGEEMRCVALDHAELVAGGKDGVVHRCVRVCV
jgi:hypothetical protein